MAKVQDYKQKYIEQYAAYLSSEGKRLLNKAYMTADFKKDKTQNLHDSYGCAVYYNGKYVLGTRTVLSPRANTPRYNTYTNQEEYGQQEIHKFFDSYKPAANGFVLVFAVAMFYGYFLENKSGKLKRKYKVISGINSDLEALAKKTGGKVIDL